MLHYLYTIFLMPLNKIYKNYFLNFSKTFSNIIWVFVIAITVRAVNFLDLVVEIGYDTSVYFKYSLLNVFGIAQNLFLFLSH